MKPTLFLSDLHLSPDRPALTTAFERFCDAAARDAASVYVLGDLFDWWIGDDQLRDPFAARIAAGLRRISEAGVTLHVGRGNRDFLLGERFAQATGARMLPDQRVLEIGGLRTLVSHGDELCIGDVDYQRLRERMRDPATQRRLLRLPYVVRRIIAASLRRKSRDATARKPESILDVDDAAVADAFRQHRATRMIHGHTHRPATHRSIVDGVPRERIVLSDWHDGGHYLAVDGGGAASRQTL